MDVKMKDDHLEGRDEDGRPDEGRPDDDGRELRGRSSIFILRFL